MASKVPGSCRTPYESKRCVLALIGATGFEVVALIGGTHPAPTRSGREPGIGSAPEGRGATVVAASAWWDLASVVVHGSPAETRGERWPRELKRRRRHGANRSAARADLRPGKQATGLRVDHLEPDRPDAVPCGQHRDVPEDRILVMRALQVVVRDLGAQVVDVVEADAAGEELEGRRQLQVRAPAQCRIRVAPALATLPVDVLELMLDVEQPHACRAGEDRAWHLDEQPLLPADEPADRAQQHCEEEVGDDHAPPLARAHRARPQTRPQHQRPQRPGPKHDERVAEETVAEPLSPRAGDVLIEG